MAPETFEQREARWARAQDKKSFMNQPKKNFTYLNSKDECKYPAQDGIRFWREDEGIKNHPENPAIVRARKNGTYTFEMTRYWRNFPWAMNLPKAGIPLDERRAMKDARSRKRKATGPPAEPQRRSKRLRDVRASANEPIAESEPAEEGTGAASAAGVVPALVLQSVSLPEDVPNPMPEVVSESTHEKEAASKSKSKLASVPEEVEPPEENQLPESRVQAPPVKSKPKSVPKRATKPKAESKARVSKAKAANKPEAKAKQEVLAATLENKLEDLGSKLPELRDQASQGTSWLATQARQNHKVPADPLWTPLLPKERGQAAAQGLRDFSGLKPDLYRPPPAKFFVPPRPSLAGWDKLIADNVELSQEDGFHSRPSIKLVMPDHLKALLVDDWENVTKNNQLVPLPHPHPVNEILEEYLAYEKPHRGEGTAAMDILEETIAGLREYFDKSLGRILLYRLVS